MLYMYTRYRSTHTEFILGMPHLGKHLCAKESFGGGRLSKEQRPKEADERAVVNMEESTGREPGKGAQIGWTIHTLIIFDQFFLLQGTE